MGKKKKKEEKPYCWYCERTFDDEKILIQHQKAQHFKCHICHKKLNTAPGMVYHVYQVHKENISLVPKAKPGKDSIKHEIFGMEGIPDDEEAELDPSKRQKLDDPLMGLPNMARPLPMPFPGMMGAPPMFNPYGAPPMFPPHGMPMMGAPPGMVPPGYPPGMAPPGMAPPGYPGMGMMPPGFPPGMAPPPPGMMFGYPPGMAPPPPGMIPPSFPPGMVPPPPGQTSPTMGGFPPVPPPLAYPPSALPPSNGVTAAAPETKTAPVTGSFQLVYDDEEKSVEEKRAELSKYKLKENEEEKIKDAVTKMNSSIESRLSALGDAGL